MNVTVEKRMDGWNVACDELIIPLWKGEEIAAAYPELDQRFDGGLAAMQADKEFSGEAKTVAIVHTMGKLAAKKLIIAGMGNPESFDFVSARAAWGRAAKVSTTKGKEKLVAIDVRTKGSLELDRLAQAMTEAFGLASYHYEGYRQKPKREAEPLSTVQLLVGSDEEAATAMVGVMRGEALAQGTNLARTLVNEPGNYLTPTALKDAVVAVAERYGMEYEVLAKDKLEELGMGGVLSVAKGSAEEPFVVAVKYQGKENWEDVIGLIGKGVTFDTGGISIKPVAGMEDMKSDMGGAAAMIGALEAIGQLKPKANILTVIGCVENMPSSTAYKPGDVITTMSGRTVEIITTDAEGRLVLADCITYAKQKGVSCLLDAATLTGGIVVALGHYCSGVMTNNDALVGEVLDAAGQAGERLWQLPTFDEYRELNKSRFADLKNSGGRYGHGIIGGVFLQEFAEETPWAHLDIAGTAYSASANDMNPAGGTGVMVRTIAQFVMNRSQA
ncbi:MULTISPECIES: leucyl aminopeptidase [Brevibacillus]|jgi:leucyl aminopeptidase|uniref:leucyl aminopeptidase n=1 Tax=Brevibacillus TaxID=55080 RepID=UPI0004F38CBC|nr:leucyl aminopeptidase [Brevibacillus borstelensis]KKX56594.1 peptidase M17 [Brevibacillus borstelensis cifa_chp40]MBE5397477.1 leucyl aminopeptidase [Brevibacillus borstelensis]MCC0562867.1 leucyl aminopeptidase [Brevibacillus borstelensis]MCM3470316.1 leucyl aminopeptidase [Brevibacillus borstelensis]MCM3557135.1 leucyl aminopeptidase [Brevibacillus borstelensis]